jgi:hypothetical protein
MKILLWILLLSILLFFSLGNTIPFIPMPSPVVSKYKSPPDYYSDTAAIQGVFSKTIEPMANAPKINGSRLSESSGNMGRSDLNQLKTNHTDSLSKLRQTGYDSSKLQARTQTDPQPVHLRSFQSTSASTNASAYPMGNLIERKPVGSSCTGSQYGCCDDGVTAKNADGTSCPSPAPIGSSCTGSQYGCCPDGVTAKNANGSSCAAYPPSGPSVYILPIQPPPPPNPYPPQPPPYQPPYPTQPNDPYTHSEQPLDTVYLSPPMGKPTVPTCPTPQPCPPCGRCPEPSFDCKKVPNYSSTSNVLPIPVLTDFSQFGM